MNRALQLPFASSFENHNFEIVEQYPYAYNFDRGHAKNAVQAFE